MTDPAQNSPPEALPAPPDATARGSASPLADTPPTPASEARRRGIDDVIFLLGSAILIAVSLWLTPDPRGLGTHEQLRLPPCMFHLLTGLPCPGCGLTTSVALMSHGQPLAALKANILGPLVWLYFAVQIPYRLARLFRPALRVRLRLPSAVAINFVALGLLFGSWAVNIALHLLGLR